MSAARWRLAARLARREVRRRPGRTALVTLLVALPIAAMTAASVLAHTVTDPWAEDFARKNGVADLVAWVNGAEAPDDTMLALALPEGSTWTRVNRVYATVRAGDLRADVEVSDLDVNHDITRGVIDVRRGRSPERADEVALDAHTARDLGVGVGDVLTLTEPAGQWTVTGIVRREDRWGQHLVVFGDFDWSRVAPNAMSQRLYVDLPSGTSRVATADLIEALAPVATFEARDVEPGGVSGDVPAGASAWGWVTGALALCVLGVIIASAFATSARRQLVTLGQLSSNGADHRLLRATMALQGSWSGLIGSLVGLAVALVALFAGRNVIQRSVQRRLGAYEVVFTDLVVVALTGVVAATVAALVPAHSIAKVPVMAALSGRRPLGAVPRRLIPIGLGLFGGGVFLLALAAAALSDVGGFDGDLAAAIAVFGGLGVLFGMCCLTPRAVDAVGRLGARASGSWRLSARSLARTRTRSAGVVTAVAAAGAFALGGSVMFASAQAPAPDTAVPSWMPEEAVLIAANRWSNVDPMTETSPGRFVIDLPGHTPAEVPPDVLARVRAVVPADEFVRRVAVWDPASYTADQYSMRLDPVAVASEVPITYDDSGAMVIADEFLLDLIGLSNADRQRLQATGAMSLEGATEPPLRVVHPTGSAPLTVDVVAPREPIRTRAGVWTTLITAERADELGLTIVDDGRYLVSSTPLTDRQFDDLRRLQYAQLNDGPTFDRPVPAFADEGQLSVSISTIDEEPDVVSEAAVNLLVGAAALLLTLLVVAVGLALSAAESRDERDVLVAIGATPSRLSRVAGQKAALLAALGAALAVPTGLAPAMTVIGSLRDEPGELPLDVPWLVIGLLVIVVPATVGAFTWCSSAITQRVRPVRMSTLAVD